MRQIEMGRGIGLQRLVGDGRHAAMGVQDRGLIAVAPPPIRKADGGIGSYLGWRRGRSQFWPNQRLTRESSR